MTQLDDLERRVKELESLVARLIALVEANTRIEVHAPRFTNPYPHINDWGTDKESKL